MCSSCAGDYEDPDASNEMMTPCELFAEIADRITMVCKQPYRTEPVTLEEWDKIRDAVITMEVVNGDASSGDRKSERARN